MKGKLFIISAPSGGGKTTLCELLEKSIPSLAHSVSLTTRPARKGEKNGRHYIFVSKKEFRERIKKGRLLEWVRNFGYYYGTPKERVLNFLNRGKDVILAIYVKGAMKIKKICPQGVLIFVLPPSIEELRKRLKARGDNSAKEISNRLRIARKEMAYLPRYDYSVLNDNISSAVERLEAIVKAERRKNTD